MTDPRPVVHRLREHAALVAVVLILGAIWFPLTFSAELASIGGDSALYMQVARHYAPYVPGSPVLEDSARNSPFPPLFPLYVALTGGAGDLRLAHAATVASFLGAIVALYFWLTAAGVPRGAAAVLLGGFGLLPGTGDQLRVILSEPLYLALATAALVAMQALQPGASRWTLLAAIAWVAAAIMTRTVGIALLPALALALWRARIPRAPAWFAAALLPSAIWAAVHHPENSYITGFLEHLRAEGRTLDGALWALSIIAKYLAYGFLNNLFQVKALAPAGVALALAAALCTLAGLRRLRPDAVYFCGYLAIILVWPYPVEAQRFAWLAVPLALGLVAREMCALTPRLRSARAAGALAWSMPAATLLVALPVMLLGLGRFHAADREADPRVRYLPEWYGVDFETSRQASRYHLHLSAAMVELGRKVPPGECVYSIKPTLVEFHAQRASFNPPPEWSDDAQFDQQVSRRGCRYFLVLAARGPAFSVPNYPAERLGDRAQAVATHEISGVEVGALLRLKDR